MSRTGIIVGAIASVVFVVALVALILWFGAQEGGDVPDPGSGEETTAAPPDPAGEATAPEPQVLPDTGGRG